MGPAAPSCSGCRGPLIEPPSQSKVLYDARLIAGGNMPRNDVFPGILFRRASFPSRGAQPIRAVSGRRAYSKWGRRGWLWIIAAPHPGRSGRTHGAIGGGCTHEPTGSDAGPYGGSHEAGRRDAAVALAVIEPGAPLDDVAIPRSFHVEARRLRVHHPHSTRRPRQIRGMGRSPITVRKWRVAPCAARGGPVRHRLGWDRLSVQTAHLPHGRFGWSGVASGEGFRLFGGLWGPCGTMGGRTGVGGKGLLQPLPPYRSLVIGHRWLQYVIPCS